MNTLLLALDHHDMNPILDKVLTYGNYVSLRTLKVAKGFYFKLSVFNGVVNLERVCVKKQLCTTFSLN